MNKKDTFYSSSEKHVKDCLKQLFKGKELEEQLEYMKDDGFYYKKNNRRNSERNKANRKVSRICNKTRL